MTNALKATRAVGQTTEALPVNGHSRVEGHPLPSVLTKPTPRESTARPSERSRLAGKTRLAPKKTRRARWFVAVAVVAAGAALWFMGWTTGEVGTAYRFVTLERGDVEQLVSSTGTLDPVTTVQVGTQVSGIISEILVDFNDEVQRGQVVARIDPTLLDNAVREAQANLARTLAQLRQLESEFSKTQTLWNEGLAARLEYETSTYAVEVARESVSSAEIALERAKQNLSYATVYAPISGTVIERNVDVGQTVAASLSAPQLFLIADDLSHMQIVASVDESDIGRIHDEQTVRFSVQAYPGRVFAGVVRQVRLQSTVQENVVNYTVVVDVDNAERLLLPGMTATADFLVETAEDVLKAPNATLRFTPTEDMLVDVKARPADGERDVVVESGSSVRPMRLWYLDPEAGLAAATVQTGISDGRWTEVSGPRLKEGMQLIVGVEREASSATNPFQSETSQGGSPRRPSF